jgi:hypothetical protein
MISASIKARNFLQPASIIAQALDAGRDTNGGRRQQPTHPDR